MPHYVEYFQVWNLRNLLHSLLTVGCTLVEQGVRMGRTRVSSLNVKLKIRYLCTLTYLAQICPDEGGTT